MIQKRSDGTPTQPGLSSALTPKTQQDCKKVAHNAMATQLTPHALTYKCVYKKLTPIQEIDPKTQLQQRTRNNTIIGQFQIRMILKVSHPFLNKGLQKMIEAATAMKIDS